MKMKLTKSPMRRPVARWRLSYAMPRTWFIFEARSAGAEDVIILGRAHDPDLQFYVIDRVAKPNPPLIATFSG